MIERSRNLHLTQTDAFAGFPRSLHHVTPQLFQEDGNARVTVLEKSGKKVAVDGKDWGTVYPNPLRTGSIGHEVVTYLWEHRGEVVLRDTLIGEVLHTRDPSFFEDYASAFAALMCGVRKTNPALAIFSSTNRFFPLYFFAAPRKIVDQYEEVSIPYPGSSPYTSWVKSQMDVDITSLLSFNLSRGTKQAGHLKPVLSWNQLQIFTKLLDPLGSFVPIETLEIFFPKNETKKPYGNVITAVCTLNALYKNHEIPLHIGHVKNEGYYLDTV